MRPVKEPDISNKTDLIDNCPETITEKTPTIDALRNSIAGTHTPLPDITIDFTVKILPFLKIAYFLLLLLFFLFIHALLQSTTLVAPLLSP